MPLKSTAGNYGEAAKGRGAASNPEGRFEKWERGSVDDGWFQVPEEEPSRPKTIVAIERAKSIISRNDSPDVGFSQSVNPYRGCEHACIYCSSGDTLVLMGDGTTRPIADLRVGEEIYGTRRVGHWRRYTKSRVLAHWSSIKPAFRTTLADGTSLVTSGDHRFLTERGWKHVADASSGQRPHLTLNNSLLGTGAFAEGPSDSDDYRRGYLCGMLRGDGLLRTYEYEYERRTCRIEAFRLALCDPPALLRTQDYLLDFGIATHEGQYRAASGNYREMNAIRTGSRAKADAIREMIRWPAEPGADWSKGFLAGIFDAEGSLSQTVFRIPNTDPEIIGWTERCLQRFGFRFAREHVHYEHRKPIDVVRLKGGLREQLRFFHTTAPAIHRKLDLEGQAVKGDTNLKVERIEPLGKAMRLFDITTETEDFIANGVISHNCFARPSHAYLGLSPGLDFETRLTAKSNAAELLREAFSKPGYKCDPLAIGVNTDAYQPIEREHRITRSILEVCHETKHPVHLITKSALIERDLDLLVPMARENLVHATLSVTTLDHEISRRMEPRTSAPARRVLAVERLAKAGVPVGVNVAPVIPFLTDSELESIMEAAKNAGATSVNYILMRLPWEVKDLFREWLQVHFPLKADHVMSRVHQMRGGKDNDPRFGSRMKGEGLFAQLLKQRFDKAHARLGFSEKTAYVPLDTTKFIPPSRNGQAKLF